MKLSATIITLNEEKNLERAIKSLDFVDEIIIVDSFSNDATEEIAKKYNCKFIKNKFEGYGQQKNFAASQCANDWILNIDSDEEVSLELKKTITTLLSGDEPACQLYALNRSTSFCGKWICHGGWYPDYVTRLGNKKHVRWTAPEVHENLELSVGGPCGRLEGHLNHYSFPTVKSQVDTNVKYAYRGASDLIRRKGRRPNLFELFARPVGKFFECYFLKLGFLDGLAGLIIAINATYSMFMKYTFAYWDELDD
ncbi:MAG: glycosyltransferase family 2 protein [Bacteriovoracaceae bacterium]|nr:glycosyltransferase family 2 protein [Bacteriovoracaceae bacterium]